MGIYVIPLDKIKFMMVSIVSVVLSIAPIFGNSLLGGVRLREALTLRFEGRIPTFLKRCGGDYAGEGNVPQSVVLCDATIVSADYLAVV